MSQSQSVTNTTIRPSDDQSAQTTGFDGDWLGLKPPLTKLTDEVVSWVILHGFLWYRDAPPAAGPQNGEAWRLVSGEIATFYGPASEPISWEPLSQPRRTAAHDVFDVLFPSPVKTPFPENNQVWVRHWRCVKSGRQRAVLGLDGLVQIGDGWFRRLARYLAPHGIDMVMMDEPFNFRRTPHNYRPGQLILNGDLRHQLSVLRQAVLDARCVVRSLRGQGYELGVVGISFGGFLALLLAMVEPELRFAISLIPPVDPVTLLREGGQLVRAMRRALGPISIDDDQFLQAVRPVRPFLWTPRIPPESIHLHAARYDRIVPSKRIGQLAQTWRTGFTLHNAAHWEVYRSAKYSQHAAGQVVAFLNGP